MNNSKLVSIFLPYYNDKLYIFDTIYSILNQTYINFELFLFNHASTDGSRDIARSFDDNRIIHIDAEKNLGAGSGLNLKNTLPLMHGEYIKLYCADDIMEPNCLFELVTYLEIYPDKDFIFSDTKFIDEFGILLNDTWFTQRVNIGLSFECDEKEILKLLFIRHSPLCYSTSLIKKDALNCINIDKTTILLFDIYLWTSLLINGKKIGLINKKLISYRIHKNQISFDGFLFFYNYNDNELNKHYCTGFVEVIKIYNIFYEIKDINIVKYLCESSPYINKLNDIELIPFVIAHYYLNIFNYSSKFASYHKALYLCGYLKMFDLLQNENTCMKIENIFNFGIKDFRDLYYNNLYFIDNNINLETQLSNILNSRTWRYGKKISNILRKILPKEALRTKIIKYLIKHIKYFRQHK